jgi:flagellar motor switch protein FliM
MKKRKRNNLTLEKIQQLLSSVGIQQGKIDDKIEATDYDWKQPHYFNSKQFEKLNDFADVMSSAIASKFSRFFQDSFEAQASEISQYYAGKFINEILESEKKDYYSILKNEKDFSCGLLILTTQTVMNWLKLLLGDEEAKENSEGQLSRLEESLLCDIVSCLSEAIINSNKQFNLKAAKEVLSNNFTLDIADSQELCRITFDIKQKDAEQGCRIDLLLPCSRFVPIVGTARKEQKLTPEQAKSVMLEHAKQLPVSVIARFTPAELSFEEILTLQKGDILMLDKKVTEPLELVVQGKAQYLAQPVKSQGKLAVMVTHTKKKDEK